MNSADYAITAVRYDDTGERVSEVVVQKFTLLGFLGGKAIWSRKELASACARGEIICCVYKMLNDRKRKGEKISFVDGEICLHGIPSTERELPGLPTF